MRWFHLLIVTAIILPSLARAQTNGGAEVVRELNRARQEPANYARFLEEMRRQFQGSAFILPNGARLRTHEGIAALDEAIRFLRQQQSLAPLVFSNGISLCAGEHVAEQRNGQMGHIGSAGSNPGERMNRYGTWAGGWGENIAYGRSSPRAIVIALIIDDGQRARKHRKNIFNPDFHFAGAAMGPHARFGVLCNIDFAEGYFEGTRASRNMVADN